MADETPHNPDDDLGFTDRAAVRMALFIVAFGALCGILYIASPILIPTVFAIFLSYILGPPVDWLSSLKIPGTSVTIPRTLTSLLMVLVSVTLVTILGIFIVDEVLRFASAVPEYEDQIGNTFENIRATVMSWQTQAESWLHGFRPLEDRPVLDTPKEQPSEEVRVLLDQTTNLWSSVSSYVFGSITSILTFTGQALTCLFVLFFILLEGPVLKTKAITMAGNSLKRRRIMLEILHNVNEDVQRYLFNRFVTNTILALVVGLVYWIFGLRFAFLMGVLAGLFNFVPYVGPAVGSVFPPLIAYIQFGDWKSALWVWLIYGLLTGVEGNLITPIVLGRHLKLNSLAVLLACIFWGWLWGPIGLFLAVPIMAVFKAMAEHIDGIRPMGELLRG